MEDTTKDSPASCSAGTNWCCVMDNLSNAHVGDGPAPAQPTKLFEWLAAKNLTQIEDEVPPTSFYEILESADIAFYCSSCDKVLISVQADSLEHSDTQTHLKQLSQAHTQTIQRQASAVQAQTQTPKHTQIERQTQTEVLDLDPHYIALYRRPNIFIQGGLAWIRSQSPWTVLKTFMLIVSLAYSCSLLWRVFCNTHLFRQMLLSMQLVSTPIPPPPLPLHRTLPGFVWNQVCRLGRALRLI